MEQILRPPLTKFTDLMHFYHQLKLLLLFYALQPMKFEVHDKQYFQVWLWKQPSQAKILQIYSGKSGQNGAAGNNFTIFIVKTEAQ